jgi:predicted transcriptional regulator
MLDPILRSSNRKRVLIYLHAREKGYARVISRFFDADLSLVQVRLERLEAGGVIVSKEADRTVLYSFNTRYPFLRELQSLLEKALIFIQR